MTNILRQSSVNSFGGVSSTSIGLVTDQTGLDTQLASTQESNSITSRIRSFFSSSSVEKRDADSLVNNGLTADKVKNQLQHQFDFILKDFKNLPDLNDSGDVNTQKAFVPVVQSKMEGAYKEALEQANRLADGSEKDNIITELNTIADGYGLDLNTGSLNLETAKTKVKSRHTEYENLKTLRDSQMDEDKYKKWDVFNIRNSDRNDGLIKTMQTIGSFSIGSVSRGISEAKSYIYGRTLMQQNPIYSDESKQLDQQLQQLDPIEYQKELEKNNRTTSNLSAIGKLFAAGYYTTMAAVVGVSAVGSGGTIPAVIIAGTAVSGAVFAKVELTQISESEQIEVHNLMPKAFGDGGADLINEINNMDENNIDSEQFETLISVLKDDNGQFTSYGIEFVNSLNVVNGQSVSWGMTALQEMAPQNGNVVPERKQLLEDIKELLNKTKGKYDAHRRNKVFAVLAGAMACIPVVSNLDGVLSVLKPSSESVLATFALGGASNYFSGSHHTSRSTVPSVFLRRNAFIGSLPKLSSI